MLNKIVAKNRINNGYCHILFGSPLDRLSPKFKIDGIPTVVYRSVEQLQFVVNNGRILTLLGSDDPTNFDDHRVNQLDRLISAFSNAQNPDINTREILTTIESEIVYILLRTFLSTLPQPLLQSITDELSLTSGKPMPMLLCMQQSLSQTHLAVLNSVLRLFNIWAGYDEVTLSKIVTKNIQYFFNKETSMTVKILRSMIIEYPRLFRVNPPSTPSLLSSEEIVYGPIEYVKYQTIDSAQNGSDEPTMHPLLGCIRVWITNYRLLYRTWDSRESLDSVEMDGIELSSILSLRRTPNRYQKLVSRLFKVIYLAFLSKNEEEMFVGLVTKLSFHKPTKSLFAFTQDPSSLDNSQSLTIGKNRNISTSGGGGLSNSGVGFSLSSSGNLASSGSFSNQAVVSLSSSTSSISSTSASSSIGNVVSKITNIGMEYQRMNLNQFWRISLMNARFDVCPTYSSTIIIPASILDVHLRDIANYRVNRRFPAVTWCSMVPMSGYHVFLAISQQPCVDSQADYDFLMIQELYKINNNNRSNNIPLIIFETGFPPKKPTYENSYSQCRFIYLGLDDGDRITNSFTKLLELCTSNAPTERNRQQQWRNSLVATEWTSIISNTLRCVMRVTEIFTTGQSAIIQSAGHDCEEILMSSLAQLILDPFYRTLSGIQVLIQKEWIEFGICAFGHSPQRNSNSVQYGPLLFVIFCECIIQLILQFPTDFEFSQSFINFICTQSFTGRFGTFLAKSHKDAVQLNILKATQSVWVGVAMSSERFTNPYYKAYSLSALPIKQFNLSNITLWSEFYTKWMTASARVNALKTLKSQIDLKTTNTPLSPSSPRFFDINLSSMGLFDLPNSFIQPNVTHLNKQINSINLSDNYLGSIPNSILRFENLKELIIDNNLIYGIPSTFWMLLNDKIKGLENLSIVQNYLTVIPREIGLYTTLIRLNLMNNEITEISPHISKLNQLAYLNLSTNQLESFGVELVNLHSLTELDFSCNRIKSLPGLISELIHLKVVKLNNNQIQKIPNSLSSLVQLQHLNISNNQLQSIESICNIASLEELILDNNQIAEIPLNVCKLVQLKFLSIQYNQIKELPDELTQLKKLNTLKLGHNNIAWLPPTISSLESLETFFIPHNQLENLPQSLAMMTSITNLDIEGNKLKRLDQSGSTVSGNSSSSNVTDVTSLLTQMKEYIESIQPCLRAKMVFLGANKGGRSSLCFQLFYQRKATKVITDLNKVAVDVDQIPIYVNSPPFAKFETIDGTATMVDLRVWEFSGNKSFWPIQPYFFTEKAIYVVQFNFTNDINIDNEVLDYWLDIISHRFSTCKIFAIGIIPNESQNDQNYHQWLNSWKQLNKNKLYVNRQIEFIFLKLSDSDDLETLKDRLVASLPSSTMVNEMIPSPFILLEKYLIERKYSKPLMTMDDIVEMAAIYNIRGRSKIGMLLKFLENTGSILNFASSPDKQLSDLLVTNSQWLLHAFSSLILQAQPTQGLLKISELLPIPLAVSPITPTSPGGTISASGFGTITGGSGAGLSVREFLNLNYRFNLIALVKSIENPLPIPLTSGVTNQVMNDYQTILVHKSHTLESTSISSSSTSNSTEFSEWLSLHSKKSDKDFTKIQRIFQFKSSLPVTLFSTLSNRLSQYAKVNHEYPTKLTTFTSIQDFSQSSGNSSLIESVRLMFDQTADNTLSVTVAGPISRFYIIQDLLSKAIGVIESMLNYRFPLNRYKILVPCPHCSNKEKYSYYILEQLELAFINGLKEAICPLDQEPVPLSEISPDISLTYSTTSKIEDHLSIIYDNELARGGFGIVYKGRYNDQEVAIKRLINMDINNSNSSGSGNSGTSSQPTVISSGSGNSSSSSLELANLLSIGYDKLRPEDNVDVILCFRDFRRELYTFEYLANCKRTLKVVGLVLSPLCLVTEFIHFGDLEKFINKHRPFSYPLALRIGLDIAQGLHELHQQTPPLHHNDLKPPNLLIKNNPITKEKEKEKEKDKDKDKEKEKDKILMRELMEIESILLIADLGTVRDTFSSRLEGRIVDNPIYLAPEIMRNQWFYNHSVDVYSFGVILYEMISPIGFFSGESFFGNVEQMVCKGNRPTIPTNCPPAYRRLINQCWQQDYTQRPSFQQIIDSLQEMINILLYSSNSFNNNLSPDVNSNNNNNSSNNIINNHSPTSTVNTNLIINNNLNLNISNNINNNNTELSPPQLWKGAIKINTKLRTTPYLKSHAEN